MQPLLPPATALGLSVLSVALISGCAPLSGQEGVLQARVGKSPDTIEHQTESGGAVFLVTCPSGIGTASISQGQGDWPTEVRLRYAADRPFTKVEGFTCTAGSNRTVEVRRIRYGPDYAEVRVPPEVLRSCSRQFRVQWVDYYR